ncbi:MAG TPA: serine/threonine protein kinase, partial [Lentisphaeria bacterium]|nr:serine/threonine protein kinase [Lentisphaeria bacterium]
MSDLSQGSMPISGNITHTRKTISQLLEERGLSTGVPMPLSVNVDTDPSERYQIGRLIATGGVAEIFEAVDTGSRRVMAMKVMSPGKISNDADLVRFVEEAQITAQLEHPGIPPVYDFGVDADGNVYYTMKLVPGRTLEAILSDIREGKQETIRKYGLARLLSILMQVCDAVEYAHSRGVIHRNLKPENIMVGSYDDVQVMDWGVAKVLPNRGVTDRRTVDQTVDGEMIGTPEYMAPEQAYGKISEIDERSDVYALGGVLYAILTLRP